MIGPYLKGMTSTLKPSLTIPLSAIYSWERGQISAASLSEIKTNTCPSPVRTLELKAVLGVDIFSCKLDKKLVIEKRQLTGPSNWKNPLKIEKYHRKYGHSFVNVEPDSDTIPTPRRVTFSDKDERFADVEAEESVEDIILQSLMPEPYFVTSGDELDEDTFLAAAEQLETNKRKWEVDENVPSYPSIDHCEEVILNSVLDTTSMIGTQVPIQPTVTTTRTCLRSNRKARSSAVLLPEMEKDYRKPLQNLAKIHVWRYLHLKLISS